MADKVIGAWFSTHQKPTRKGIYPVRLPTSSRVWSCYWRGDSWGAVSDKPTQAATTLALVPSPVQNKAWFGFSEAA
jgi:hypothetical protein